jgi:RNase adapter protein RapZ
MHILVISGLSGGGKSTALQALEDLGAYCVDNVPVPLLTDLVGVVGQTDADRLLAVGIDARTSANLEQLIEGRRTLEVSGHTVEVVFLEAEREILVRRYSETRRMHPMGELPHAIDRERALLIPVRAMSERPIDTSQSSARQLRQLIRDRFGTSGTLRLVLQSFGFRNGLPSEADVVIDARFLANPHEVDALRPLSGLQEPVARYVLDQPDAQSLLAHVEALVRFCAPRSANEGRSYLTIAIGCTGGQHRSVALVEELKRRLGGGDPIVAPVPRLVVRHRDVGGGA